MTHEEALELMDKMHKEELVVATTKGKEYTKHDRLDNFYRIGTELDINPKQVLWVYLKKHIDSICYFVKEGNTLSESIESRIMDARVYLCLLRGIIEEEKMTLEKGE